MKFNDESISVAIELVDELEEKSLKLNNSEKGSDIYVSMIHSLFRTCHNLKGTFAIAEIDELVNLMHLLEDAYDKLRNRPEDSPDKIISTTFKAVDFIRDSINNSDIDIALLKELENELVLNEVKKSRLTKGTVFDKLTSSAQEKLLNLVDEGYSTYYIDKQLLKTISKEDYENLPIFEDISFIGEFIGMVPDFKELKNYPVDPVVHIIFASKKNDEIDSYIFDPYKKFDLPVISEKKRKVLKVKKTLKFSLLKMIM